MAMFSASVVALVRFLSLRIFVWLPSPTPAPPPPPQEALIDAKLAERRAGAYWSSRKNHATDILKLLKALDLLSLSGVFIIKGCFTTLAPQLKHIFDLSL
jgi:hypothetical protein